MSVYYSLFSFQNLICIFNPYYIFMKCLMIILLILLARCTKSEIEKDALPTTKKKIISKDIERFDKIYGNIYHGIGDDRNPCILYGVDEQFNIKVIKVNGEVIKPDSLFTFKNVKSLWINHNSSIFQKPLNLKNLYKLEKIFILYCDLPKNIIIENPKSLKYITIEGSKNPIESLKFSNPLSIEDLYLGTCKIEKIPLNIKEMDSLRVLALYDNNVNYINFDNLPKNLKIIRLRNNPIITIHNKKRNIGIRFEHPEE